MLLAPQRAGPVPDPGFFSGSKDYTLRRINVTTRTVVKAESSPSSSLSSSPLTSPGSTPPRKRKSISPERVSSKAEHPKVKKLKTEESKVRRPAKARSSTPSSSSSRSALSPLPSPDPIYRNSRSRSTSIFPTDQPSTTRPPVRTRWAVDADGYVGDNLLSCEKVVKTLMKSYKPFFKDHDHPENNHLWGPDPENYPRVELEYPNDRAVETFILLAPKDKDHYNPILDLQRTLYTIVECYLTPAQQNLIGRPHTDILFETASPPPSPSPSPPHSRSSSSSRDSLSSLTSLSSTECSPPRPRTKQTNYCRALQRAITKQDGPMFVKTVNQINLILRKFKYPSLSSDPFDKSPRNTLKESVEKWNDPTHHSHANANGGNSEREGVGIPKEVLMRILEENYQRCVGPNIPTLRKYEAFSSTVYGELMPNLVRDMLRVTNVNENSLFLDLGSGVGNIVVQAALQCGCKSFGVELMPGAAGVARVMKEQFRMRCRMWGVDVGEMELEEADMLTSKTVDELIPKADVVLVDNKVFEESLNEAIRPKFLDLKEGAVVISLRPFVKSTNAQITERNVDDISAIFDVEEHSYYPGGVSWGPGGGSWFLHRVDRVGYAEVYKRYESQRISAGTNGGSANGSSNGSSKRTTRRERWS